jgi:hypothetical protein
MFKKSYLSYIPIVSPTQSLSLLNLTPIIPRRVIRTKLVIEIGFLVYLLQTKRIRTSTFISKNSIKDCFVNPIHQKSHDCRCV